MGCQDAGLLGRRGKHVSPSWLHTDLLLYQRNWTAADMGDNFLSGCAGMHCDLVPNTGLARRPVFITNCLLQSQRRRIFHVAAAPLDYYAHPQLPRIDISSGPSIRTTPWRLPYSFLCQHTTIILWSIINMPQRVSAEMAMIGWDDVKHHHCEPSQSKGGRHGCLHHPSAFKHRKVMASVVNRSRVEHLCDVPVVTLFQSKFTCQEYFPTTLSIQGEKSLSLSTGCNQTGYNEFSLRRWCALTNDGPQLIQKCTYATCSKTQVLPLNRATATQLVMFSTDPLQERECDCVTTVFKDF